MYDKQECAIDHALPTLLYRRFCGSFSLGWRFDQYKEALAEPLPEHGQPGSNRLQECLEEFIEKEERGGLVHPVQDGIKLLMADNMTGTRGISERLPEYV